MASTGVYFFEVTRFMTNLVIQLDGRVCTRAGVEQDAVNPWSLVRSQRSVVQAVADSGKRTRLDLVCTDGLSLVHESGKRNSPVTLAALLIRAGHDDVIEAMEVRFAAFIAEEIAA